MSVIRAEPFRLISWAQCGACRCDHAMSICSELLRTGTVMTASHCIKWGEQLRKYLKRTLLVLTKLSVLSENEYLWQYQINFFAIFFEILVFFPPPPQRNNCGLLFHRQGMETTGTGWNDLILDT